MSRPTRPLGEVDRTVAAAVAFSLVTRVGAAWLAADLVPRNDAHVYVSLGRILAESGSYDELFRPPLYPAFLAAVFSLGGGLGAARIVQALLATLSVALVARIAGRAFGARAAGIAAWIVALDPVLTGFSHLLWSETLYILLLLVAVDAWCVADEKPGPRWIVAGVALGLAALARPQVLTFAPLMAALAVWRAAPATRRDALRWAALGLVALAATVAPWTLRNVARTGAFVVIDTNGPFNFLVGTEPGAAYVDKDDRWSLAWGVLDGEAYVAVSRRDPARAQAEGTARALANLAADPLGWAGASLWEARHLHTLDSFPLRHLRNGWYGPAPPAGIAVATLVGAGFSFALLAGGLLALVALPRSALRDLGLLAVVHATLLFGATYALSRYAVPLRPFLALALAGALAQPGLVRARLLGAERTPLRTAVAGLVLLALASGLWSDAALLVDMLFRGGAGHRFAWLPAG